MNDNKQMEPVDVLKVLLTLAVLVAGISGIAIGAIKLWEWAL